MFHESRAVMPLRCAVCIRLPPL